MRYATCILKGDNSEGTCITISVAGEGQEQDSGARMIHLGKNTKSNIISKSIARSGGNASYRGKVDISVSQNFITSKNTIYKLIKKTNISKNDFVIEIGPGKGHITEALCEKSYWVTAIELDRSLYGNLINKFKSKNNVTLINKFYQYMD